MLLVFNMSSVIPHHTAKLAHKDKLTKRDLDDQQMIDTIFRQNQVHAFRL
jgi:hypothetical protein